MQLQEETVWLSQKQLAELFQNSVPNINMHIKNIFDEKELRPDSVIKDFLITAAERYRVAHLNDSSPVEKHFLEAVSEMKQIEQGRKSTKGKKGE